MRKLEHLEPANDPCRSLSPKAEALFARLSARHRTPYQVQKLIKTLPYNTEPDGETVRSALQAWNHSTAHCLEAAFIAASILERHGYPPLVVSLESKDDLDHVLYVFREESGWGAIGRSRDEGLHGRAPVFRSIRDLVWSYYDPYIDLSAKITGYALANLDDSGTPWRDSLTNVWKAEQYLIDYPHLPLRSSLRRYRRILNFFKNGVDIPKQDHWW